MKNMLVYDMQFCCKYVINALLRWVNGLVSCNDRTVVALSLDILAQDTSYTSDNVLLS